MRQKNLLTLAVFSIFLVTLLIGSVSAWEFDNVKSYDPISKTIVYRDSILGLPTTEVGQVKLLSSENELVPVGNDTKVAEFEITVKESSYKNVIKNMELYYARTTLKETDKEIWYKYAVEKEIEVPVYSDKCSVAKNSSLICTPVQTGTEKQTVTEWLPFDEKSTLSSGTIRIGIFTDTKEGEVVEWIPTFFGVRSPEWATWTASLYNDLISYWTFNESSGSAVDSYQGKYNLTERNSPTHNINGVIGTAFKVYDNNDVGYDGTITELHYSTIVFSVAGWLNMTGNSANAIGWGMGTTLSDNDLVILQMADTNTIKLYNSWDGDRTITETGDSSGDGEYHHYAVTYDGTNFRLYIDGVLNGSGASNRPSNTPNTFRFGVTRRSSGYVGPSQDTKSDEWGLWNRTLTATEISTLYNNGAGITLGAGEPPTITLNSPENETLYTTSPQTIAFNATITDDVEVANATLWLNGVELNTTDGDGSGTLNYYYETSLGEGIYTWNITARDDESAGASSNNRIFTIDATAPNVTILAPPNATQFVTSSSPFEVNINVSIGDNLGLDTCSYFDGTTNHSLTCGNNITANFSAGWNTVEVYANDSVGYSDSDSVSFFINVVNETLNYQNPIVEQETQNIIFYLDATSISSFNGTIYYNNTPATLVSLTSNSTRATLTSSATSPEVTGSANVPIWVNYTLNGVNYSMSYVNQTVNELTDLIITNNSCSDKAVRFDLRDEQDHSSIYGDIEYNFKFGLSNSTLKVVYGTFTNVTTFYACINASISNNYTVGYGEIAYSSTDYVNRRNYIFEGREISNATLYNVTLYELPSADQTSFLISAEDTDLTEYPEKYIALWRWYPNLNEYRVVEMSRTDENGETVSHVEAEDVDYRVGLYERNGSLIKLGDPIRFVCQATPCTFTLRVDANEADYTSYLGVESSLTYNETTQIFRFVYNDPSQNTDSMRLTVTKETGTGSIELCSNTASGYTGAISCDVSAYSGTFKAVAYRTASPEVPIATKLISTASTAFKSQFGLFISMFLWLAMVLTGFSSASVSPIIIIIFGIVGLIPGLLMGSINAIIFTGVIVLGAIIIHFIKRGLAR